MRYPTYEKNHNISTPHQKRAMSSCTHKSHKSAASHVTELGQDHVLEVVSLKSELRCVLSVLQIFLQY